MKNKLIRAIIFYTLFTIAFLIMGCKAMQQTPIVIKETTTVENSDFARVKSELNRSLAINDSLKTFIGNIKTAKPECDSVCQEALDRVLSNLNNKKQSGNNSFGVYYDKYQKAIIVTADLKETVSQLTDSISKITSFNSKTIEVPVPAPYPVPAEFSKEQNFNLWVGRIFWILVLFWLGSKLRKIIPV